MINNMNIGKKLKELRLSRGWKQTDVADKVGLSRPAISNIESGKRALTLSRVRNNILMTAPAVFSFSE